MIRKSRANKVGKWENSQHDTPYGVPGSFDGSNMFVNTNNNFEISHTKRRRAEYQPNNFPDPIVNKSQELPKFSEIKFRAYVPAKFNSLFFIWLCFRKWNSHDQVVPTISGWLTQIRERYDPTKQLMKTTEIYLSPMVLMVTEFQHYMEYLEPMTVSVNIPYLNTTINVDAALNTFRFLEWIGETPKYQNSP